MNRSNAKGELELWFRQLQKFPYMLLSGSHTFADVQAVSVEKIKSAKWYPSFVEIKCTLTSILSLSSKSTVYMYILNLYVIDDNERDRGV